MRILKENLVSLCQEMFTLFQIKVNHLDFLYILNHDRGL